MNRFKYSLLAAAGILVLAFVLTAIGPKRVMAALGYTPVRDVDQPARQPFGINRSVTVAGGTFAAGTSFAVPAGKRLVIEQVAIAGNVDVQGQFAQENIAALVNGVSVEYPLPIMSQGGSFEANVPPGAAPIVLANQYAAKGMIFENGYLVASDTALTPPNVATGFQSGELTPPYSFALRV